MKVLGNLSCPRKFSSGKYDMTWVVCFQKFIISCSEQSATGFPLTGTAWPSRAQKKGGMNRVGYVTDRRAPHVIGEGGMALYAGGATDLVLGIVLHEQDVDDGQLVYESVALKLLPHARADHGDGEWDRVHGLDLGRLSWGRRESRRAPVSQRALFIRGRPRIPPIVPPALDGGDTRHRRSPSIGR